MKYAPWIKFEQMKKKLLLRWLRCVSFHCESALEGAQRFKRGGHKSIYIPYWRKTCEPDQQPANFIASPTFQNFSAGEFLDFLLLLASKVTGWCPKWVSLRKCLELTLFWCVCGRRSARVYLYHFGRRDRDKPSSTSIKESSRLHDHSCAFCQ